MEEFPPGSDAIQHWIKLAYREPEDKSRLDAARFTRWNMEVAYRAGVEHATRILQRS